MEKEFKNLKKICEEYDQSHLLSFFDQFESDDQKSKFLDQIKGSHIENIKTIFDDSLKFSKMHHDVKSIHPPNPANVVKLNEDQDFQHFENGLKMIAQGKVAILLLAGGQGTRLGSPLPKGMYVIEGLPSKSSMFEIQAKRIRRLKDLAVKYCLEENGVKLPWYVMTSSFNHETTQEYFASNDYFGLDKSEVIFFSQGSMPCIDTNGKIILEEKDKISFSPNGNGGVYIALKENNIIEHMRNSGIEYIHSYCVDNILVKVADPVFVSLASEKKIDLGSKVIPKREPHEKVGVFVEIDSKHSIVEYSEITKEMAERKDENDPSKLAFNCSNIVNFIYSIDFLEKCSEIMSKTSEYHVAFKAIPFVNEKGEIVKPKEPNGYKLELFNFDVCKFAKNVLLMEVNRDEEFSPLKNAPKSGKDCPETCLEHLSNFNKKIIEKAGGKVTSKSNNLDDIVCEIDPLLTYAGEGLELLVKGKTIELPTYLK